MNIIQIASITPSGKVRDRIPETPREQLTQCKPRRPAEPQPIYRDVAGVRVSDYPSVPTALWNQIASLAGECFRAVFRRFDEALVRNQEEELPGLLQEFIPEVVFSLGRGLMEAVLAHYQGFYRSRMCCHECDQELEFQGYVKKSVKTKLGQIQIKRAYYHGDCGHSAVPLDLLLGLDGKHSALPDLQEVMALLASQMSYPQAVEILKKFFRLDKFSLRLGEEVTAAVATDFEQFQRDEGHEVEPGWQSGEPLEDRTVVASVDGAMCRVRDHEETYREFKLAVIGELGPGATVVNKSYVATFEGPNAIFHRSVTEYVRKGCDRAQHLHMVVDGAIWIARRAEELAHPGQRLTLILDWYHAVEHLKECANESFGAGTAESQSWFETTKGALYEQKLVRFFKALKELAAAFPDTNSKAKKTLAYFEKRRGMLKYRTCREQGLPIGSGIVEGGIRFVGKDRLDGTGMRWNTSGAERILQLRCLHASDRWDDYCLTRSIRRQERFNETKSRWLRAAA